MPERPFRAPSGSGAVNSSVFERSAAPSGCEAEEVSGRERNYNLSLDYTNFQLDEYDVLYYGEYGART